MTSLQKEIGKFRDWEASYPIDQRSGEWECDYQNWNVILREFEIFLEKNNPFETSPSEFNDLFYIIARDNEMEDLIAIFSHRKDWLKEALNHLNNSNEADAKWQFANVLGEGVLPYSDSESALLLLVESEDEYVSRMALRALGRIGFPHTESLCERAWKTGHEYQRIMALWVLKEISSKKLPAYLAAAKDDGRQSLLHNANEIEGA